ncbi:MAG: FAD-dependent oxidoreductase [Pseudomonadota bacterium]
MNRYVIIGNGIAGIGAAETIRSLDPQGSITIVAGEEFPPYSRPMISLLLEGAVGKEQLFLRSHDFYSKLEIQTFIGEKAASLDVDAKSVLTERGRRVDYDRLLIATGADPRPIKAAGNDLGNVSFMRTQAHVDTMLQALPSVKQALVLGGGLVGFKAAYGLLRRGIETTMLIRSGYPLSMQVDETAGRLILDELTANGLQVKVGVEVEAFEGKGGFIRQARLSDGTVLPCRLAVVGKGVLPATDFVPKDRIKVDLGIVVDDHLETGVPGVYAAGDVAQAMDVARKQSWVNAIWPVAIQQGRVAGANMAGRPVSFPGSIGRNVIRVFGLDVLAGGLLYPPRDGGYTELKRFDPARKTYRRLILRGDVPVGLVMVGEIEQGGVILSLIQRQLPLAVDPELILEPSFTVATLLS